MVVLPEYAAIGVVNASKILNDVALNAVDRVRDPLIVQYIKKKHAALQTMSEKYIVRKAKPQSNV